MNWWNESTESNEYANVQEKNYTLSGAILNKLYIFAPERV
jgi:hypothetical protein